MNNKLIIGMIAVSIILVSGYIYFNSGPIVSAQGFASIKAVPDEVSVNINIQTKNKTSQFAQETNKQISEKLLIELVKLGYDRNELKFVNYNVYPEYDWNDRNKKLKGYIVSQQLVVKTKNVEKVPEIVDSIINSGALVNYINFEISDEKKEKYKKQALEKASKDSLEKAKSIASGQNRKIGRLVSIQNQNYNYPMPLMEYSRNAGDSSETVKKVAVNLSPNEQEITASIVAQYKLRFF